MSFSHIIFPRLKNKFHHTQWRNWFCHCNKSTILMFWWNFDKTSVGIFSHHCERQVFSFDQISFLLTRKSQLVPNHKSNGVCPATAASGFLNLTAGSIVKRRLKYFTGETGISFPHCTYISGKTRVYKIWVGSQFGPTVVTTSISFDCWGDWCTMEHAGCQPRFLSPTRLWQSLCFVCLSSSMLSSSCSIECTEGELNGMAEEMVWMHHISTDAPMHVISELISDLLSLCYSSLAHVDQNISLYSQDLCKGHVY